MDPVTVSAIVDYIVGLVVERVDEGAGRDLSAVIKDYLGQVSSGEIRAPSTASLLSFLEDLAEGRIPSPSTPTWTKRSTSPTIKTEPGNADKRAHLD